MNPQSPPLQIRKRDGHIEPFDVRKLRRALLRALRETRQPGYYAEPLAEAIAIHLKNQDASQPASSAYVFDCCRAVLRETGLETVARALTRYRRRRQRRRRDTHVRRLSESGMVVEAWSRPRLARTLEARYGLTASVARIVSSDVEQRVLSLGYRVVDAELIEAVVRNELRAWGLLDADVRSAAGSLTADPDPERSA